MKNWMVSVAAWRWQRKESVMLKINRNYANWVTKIKKAEKKTEFQGLVGQEQKVWHSCHWKPSRRWEKEGSAKNNMAENFPNLVKDINIQIQEVSKPAR